jgi:glycosyltransferase involved in cell wall biosynthesis
MKSARRGKVVHLTSVHDASDTRITHRECATLAEGGYEVVLVAPGPVRSLPSNVRHRSVPLPRNRLERFTKTLWNVYRAAVDERADVYHFHDPELVTVGAALRMRGARVIFDVHEDIALDIKTKAWIPNFLRPTVSACTTLGLRTIEHCFTAIVPATPTIASRFSHRRTIVVRNYPRLKELTMGGSPAPFADRPMQAMYLGGDITLVRGGCKIVEAMAHPSMPAQARLLLSGNFEDDGVKAQLMALPGWPRVDAPGRLSRPAVAEAMNRSRIGLIVLQPTATFAAALPTKLFEYMGAGLPVIAPRFLACRDIITNNDCGILVDTRDPDELAEAMAKLFNDPVTAQAMGERGRAAVHERYLWEGEARNLIGLYAEIAG